MEKSIQKENTLEEILKTIATGTELRAGLENILKTNTGALIVIGDSEEILDLVDGGFYINEKYSPSKLYELAKMDGAIVLSSDLKTILYANAQLLPSSSIQTKETGTRHRTAERVAKQTGALVISISQRRSIITVFKKSVRYTVDDTTKILSKANQALQILERYKTSFDNKLSILNEYEFNDIVTLDNVINCIQRAEMAMTVVGEINRAIYELGEDGRLVEMQLEELIGDLEEEELLIIKDYAGNKRKKDSNKLLQDIRERYKDGLVESTVIAKILGYENFENFEELAVYPKGYRILNKIPKVPSNIVDSLVKSFKSFQHILLADINKLDAVEGIGEIRARTIKQALNKMQEQFMFDNMM